MAIVESSTNTLSESTYDSPIVQRRMELGWLAWRHKWLLLAGVVIGCALSYVYYLRQPPVFQSESEILVEEQRPPALPLDRIGDATRLAETDGKHVAVLSSPLIITRAAAKPKLGAIPEFRDAEVSVVAASILENLRVTADSKASNVFHLTYSGPRPQDTRIVLEAITESYREYLEETVKSDGSKTRDLIVEAKDELLRRLEEKEQKYREFRGSAPSVWQGSDGLNMHQERQAKIEDQRSQLLLQIQQLRSQVRIIEQGLQKDVNPRVLLLAMDEAARSQAEDEFTNKLQTDQRKLDSLKVNYRTMRARYGDDHPRVRAVADELQAWQEILEQRQNDSTNEGGATNRERQLLVNYLESLKQRLKAYEQESTELSQLFAKEQQLADKLAEAQAENERMLADIRRTQQLFDAVVSGLEQVTLVQDVEGYNFQVLNPATAGEQIAPSLRRILMSGGLLALLVAFGGAYLIEVSDKAFHSPDEIGQVLRLPVMGHVMEMSGNRQQAEFAKQLSPVVCTVHRPMSKESEGFRAIRTAIYFSGRGDRHQVIQITSPTPGDGKSTLSANLAVTIAQSGKKVLLLDADFRRPTQHKIFGLDEKLGLASVVSGNVEPDDAIQPCQVVDNLSIVACGRRPDNPSELLSSEQFRNLLKLLRERFEYVIVDTPPLLPVSDALAVGAQVDTVVLTLRISKQIKPAAIRARDMLAEIGANVAGVVVNGVSARSNGYGYRYGGGGYGGGKYGYSYGYENYDYSSPEQDETTNGRSTHSNGHRTTTQAKTDVDRVLSDSS